LQIGDLAIPNVIEMTLLRKDRSPATGYATAFPHPLDRTNVPGIPDFALPKPWFRG